jgi:DNA processing protein
LARAGWAGRYTRMSVLLVRGRRRRAAAEAGRPKFGLLGHKLIDVGGAGDEERVALLALLDERPAMRDERAGATASSTIASQVSLRGSAVALWRECHPPALESMEEPGGPLDRARAWLAAWRGADFELVTVLDSAYPLALRGIHQMPPILFVKGLLLPDEAGVSVVGSRHASSRAVSIASHVAVGLVERGISVISGLASGIDTAAHEACLRAGGRPIGVLGTGINRVYPPENADLHRQVGAGGALVSQFLPDAPPQKHTFGMRNATMSGLGRASVIVEAGEFSGSRIQARVGVEHGRPVILTDRVVAATSWARQLQHRPGVHVAGSTAEVMGIVEDVVREVDVRAAAAVLSEPD